jgi:hypothetical protein
MSKTTEPINKKNTIRFVFYLAFASFASLSLYSCAKQGTLSGGPKDIQPPRLDTALSTRNFQTNFFPPSIRLYFDEWIQLKNASQILISPPTKTRPKINAKGKSVEIVFDEEEVLRDSTTYAINFGNAITDFTESNPFSNFRFVFATGDKIDSLFFRAKVIDSYTEEPVENVVVMLYDQYQDSVVYLEQPYYFSNTSKQGECTIQNIREGRFKCVALEDANYNFLYDQESERIGFIDSLIRIENDSLDQKYEIELFLEDPPLKIDNVEIVKRGKIQIKMNKAVEDLSLLSSNFDLIHKEILEDSIFYWYQPDTSSMDSIFMVVDLPVEQDTIILKSKRSTPSLGDILFKSFRSQRIKLKPGRRAAFDFNQIIAAINPDSIILQTVIQNSRSQVDKAQKAAVDSLAEQALVDSSFEKIEIDTLPQPEQIPFTVEVDSIDKRKIWLRAELKENQAYEAIFYPGAVEGYYENQNDTLVSNIELIPREELGNIFCNFDSLDASKQYLVLLKIKDRIMDKAIISYKSQAEISFLLMEAGSYLLDVIVDENGNGRWDPGNYLEKRQSERKLEIKLEELRKNWDIETEIKWDAP